MHFPRVVTTPSSGLQQLRRCFGGAGLCRPPGQVEAAHNDQPDPRVGPVQLRTGFTAGLSPTDESSEICVVCGRPVSM